LFAGCVMASSVAGGDASIHACQHLLRHNVRLPPLPFATLALEFSGKEAQQLPGLKAVDPAMGSPNSKVVRRRTSSTNSDRVAIVHKVSLRDWCAASLEDPGTPSQSGCPRKLPHQRVASSEPVTASQMSSLRRLPPKSRTILRNPSEATLWPPQEDRFDGTLKSKSPTCGCSRSLKWKIWIAVPTSGSMWQSPATSAEEQTQKWRPFSRTLGGGGPKTPNRFKPSRAFSFDAALRSRRRIILWSPWNVGVFFGTPFRRFDWYA